MNLLKTLLRESFFILWIQLLVAGSFHPLAEAKKKAPANNVVQVTKALSRTDILAKSQLSYRAHGGFSEVSAYTVLVSCSEGKISTYRAVRNNRHGTFRKSGTMTQEAYLQLWDEMFRRRVFSMKDAPVPQQEILDEFTVEFEAKVGDANNKFIAYGCSRPEASSYFALRNIIDHATEMQTVWSLHNSVARK